MILLTNHVLLLLLWWRLWRTNRWRRERKFHNSSTMLRLNIELCFISLLTVFLWFSAIVVLTNGVTWNYVLILLFKLPYNQLFGLVVGSVGFLSTVFFCSISIKKNSVIIIFYQSFYSWHIFVQNNNSTTQILSVLQSAVNFKSRFYRCCIDESITICAKQRPVLSQMMNYDDINRNRR